MIKKPNLFIVGAPKSGTTAMSHYLSACPDIFMGRKEMHFFGKDLQFSTQFYRRDTEAYLAEFSEHDGRAHAGEASVWYLLSKSAAKEIKAFNPDSRIIVMLRDPVEMLHSLYYSFRWDGNEHLPTFEAALAAENDRRNGRMVTRQTYFAPGLLYRETVRYAEQVKRYYDVFGRDRVHVILYDELAADVGAVYRQTLDFLGVDSTQIPTKFKTVNANKFVKYPALRALLGDSFVRSSVLAIRPLLPTGIFKTMQKVDARIRKLNSRSGGRPILAPELRALLNREFAPGVQQLSSLIGRDLSHWNNHYGEVSSSVPQHVRDVVRTPANAPAESATNLAA